jgi:RNA polymerase sigma-70 factor (ECF subfamily)
VEPASGVTVRPDPESLEWIRALKSRGATRDEAISRLHALLLRAARFEAGRRAPRLPHLRGGDLGDIVQQSADDALVAVLARLDDYRGASRFTTWAYKFALLETAVRLRRLAWQGREVPLAAPEGWERIADPAAAPDEHAERAELLAEIRRGMERALTPHQRDVLVALALNGVPIDVLAERLGTSRGALYKTLHDARRRLRADLARAGLDVPGARGRS